MNKFLKIKSKKNKSKIICLTAYSKNIASIIDKHCDLILVGDSLGSVLYTDYILYFQLSGVILLVAMIGSIVLTLRERDGVKRQSIQEQLDRNYKSSIELVDVKSNEGIDI